MNCSNIAKKLFYVFIFLFPVFFVSGSLVSPVMNQKAFLLIGILIPLIFFLIGVFKDKKEVIKGSLPIKLVFGFIFAILISFLISGYYFQGYWGYPIQSDSIFSFVLFFSLLFLTINIFDNEKERINAYKVFSSGALLLAFVYFFQIGIGSGKGIMMVLPSSEESAIIFSLGLTYMIFNIFQGFNLEKEKKSIWKMVFLIVFAAIFIAMIYMMGIKLAWLLSAFGAFFIFWKVMQKRKFDINSPEPFISFILIVFFIINFLLPLDNQLLKPVFSAEPVPTFSQSLDIVKKSISSNLTVSLFGTGPASFPYNFSLNKDNSFEDKDVVFAHPSSAFLLILNDFGIVGALAFISLLIYFLWFSVKLILKQRKEERDSDEILLISPLFMLFYSLFFYRFSFLIVSIFFLFLGLWISSREYRKNDYLNNNVSRIVFSAVFLALAVNVYFFFMQYSTEVKYQEAALASQNKEELDVVISKLELAGGCFENADHLIALSNLYLAKGANMYDEYFNELDQNVGDTSKKDEALGFVSKARAYAEKATEFDARDYRSWDNLAYIYKNIELVTGEKNGNVLEIYQKAEKLAPLNYRIYLSHAQKLEEDGNLLEAFALYKKAYEINPEFEGLKNFIDEIETELNNVK